MNYTEMKREVQKKVEDSFSDETLDRMMRLNERIIYSELRFPYMRKNQTSTFGAGNEYLTLPDDYLYSHEFGVIVDGKFTWLRKKSVSFLREAYSDPTNTGVPKFYAEMEDQKYMVAPTPAGSYTVQLHYGYLPPSIVDQETTWLSDNFDVLLFAGFVLQAAIEIQQEEDLMNIYMAEYSKALSAAKRLSDGKLRTDDYESLRPKQAVT